MNHSFQKRKYHLKIHGLVDKVPAVKQKLLRTQKQGTTLLINVFLTHLRRVDSPTTTLWICLCPTAGCLVNFWVDCVKSSRRIQTSKSP